MRLPRTVAEGRRWLLVVAALVVAVLVLAAVGVVRSTIAGQRDDAVAAGPAVVVPTVPTSPSTPSSPVAPDEPLSDAGPPAQVRAPAIDLAADVVPVEAEGGVLDPPSNVALVGWWSQGAEPGATEGTALLTGHSVHAGIGVFDRLGELRHGDRIVVTTLTPGTVIYEVTSVEEYPTADLAEEAADLFALDSEPRLALVTCSDFHHGIYLASTVVLAEPVSAG